MSETQTKHKLLVIVVTYNGMKWLEKCLSSVSYSSIAADLFIVDNGSLDGSIEFIRQKFPEAILIDSKENLGFGKANNIGFKYALDNNYDYVYLLNQDAWVEQDTFEKLILASNENHDYAILSPLQTNKGITKLDKIFCQFCSTKFISDAILGRKLSNIYEASFVMAAHWLIPCPFVKLIGGFSPTFFHYGEDVNFINRVRFHGKKVGIVSGCIGVHDREEREISKDKERYLFYCEGLNVLSNPNIKRNTFKFLRMYLRALVHGKSFSYFYYLCRSVRSFKKILKNRKLSTDKGAFL